MDLLVVNAGVSALAGMSLVALAMLGRIVRLLTEIRDELRRKPPAP